jgi:hypothetical protein
MKKALLTLFCLAAMMAAGTSLKAQEVTIVLNPGWNWISFPTTDTLDISEAFGSFTPMVGDMVKSKWAYSSYMANGRWRGYISEFYPGNGYMYKSNRQAPVILTIGHPLPQLSVTTAEPTDITAVSAVVGFNIAIGEGNHVFACGVCWGTEPNPNIDGDHITGEAVAGDQSFTVEGLISSTTYYIRAYMVTDYGLAYGGEQSFTTDSSEDHGYVDLGLPSGLLWATCNVGADNPEDYGDYFAWGETTPKSTYDYSTYQYCNGSSKTMTKYCSNSSYGYNGFTDNLTTLLPEDDAATANWGNDWRMPTKEEFQELYNNTTVTWTTQNGVNGRLFTASNGNSLFLPAAGYRFGSSLYDAGSSGRFWSSSLDTGSPDDAWYFYFASGNYGSMYCDGRGCGKSVRPVRSGQNSAPTGAINGLFSVSADQQVYFSQGNLQYQASTNTWKFADNQYDYVGSDNSNISSTYSGWIDLFGWGTSGWNSGNTYYHPWDSNKSSGSTYGPSGQYSLTGSYANADWGVYNPISNGGNTANQWRTLTQPEWDYVFNTRTTTSGIRYAKANVNNVNGFILLPDDWSSSTYILSNTNSSGASFSGNTLTASQWSILEQAGAVFLPAAGYRNGTSVYYVGSIGNYWSASYSSSSNAYSVDFSNVALYTSNGNYRYSGQSVRLVRVAEN